MLLLQFSVSCEGHVSHSGGCVFYESKYNLYCVSPNKNMYPPNKV